MTSSQRTALLPDVPTLAECGTPGADAETWWGIAGPAGMPADVVNALNAEINKILDIARSSPPFSPMRAPKPNP